MKILKKSFITIFLAVSFLFSFTFSTVVAKADTGYDNEGVQPRGVYTSLVLTVDGGNGGITATVKNKISVFPSNVYVIVQLYSSETYQDSYLNMELEAQNSITDLDMGKTITATAPTNGVTRYWKARARYKIDSKDWQEKMTEAKLYDGSGVIIN